MFQNIDWFFIVTISITIIFGLVVLASILKKGKITGLVVGLAMGLIGLVVLLISMPFIDVSINSIDNTRKALGILGWLFITFISLAIPFYIFLVIFNFITGENIGKIKVKTFMISFSSLLGLALFGIIVAMILVPIIFIIPEDLFSTFGETDQVQQSSISSFFTDWRLILLMVSLGIISSVFVRIFYKKDKSSIARINLYFGHVLLGLTKYFDCIVRIVPFVIMTRILSLGLLEPNEAANTFELMGIYMGMFWLGALFIFSVLLISNILLSHKGLSIKKRASILLSHCLTVFGTQSIQASLPQTQISTRELGVSDEISQLTPSNGTIMGMVMCNGFTPMLVIALSLANDPGDMLTIQNIFIVGLLIFGFSISSSGSGSADHTIILTILNIFSISPGLYLTVIMPMQEINESTIAKPINSLGHIAATQITEIYHKKNKI